jgi:hypothetical protein
VRATGFAVFGVGEAGFRSSPEIDDTKALNRPAAKRASSAQGGSRRPERAGARVRTRIRLARDFAPCFAHFGEDRLCQRRTSTAIALD